MGLNTPLLYFLPTMYALNTPCEGVFCVIHKLYTPTAICVSTYTLYNNDVQRFIHLCNIHMEKADQVLHIHKQMDEAFIAKFCELGSYLDGQGQQIHGVCRQVSADEMLSFIHEWNAVLVEVIKK